MNSREFKPSVTERDPIRMRRLGKSLIDPGCVIVDFDWCVYEYYVH